MALERLQKVLAAAGLGSRRSCELLIEQGRVTVAGETVTELGTRADPDQQEIRCDGELVRPRRKLYYLVNKPRGLVCTSDDERGRPTVFHLLPARDQRLFTIGRLDANSEGLLIVTNDGDFAQRVAHPRNGVTKTYIVEVAGRITPAAARELLHGVWVAGHLCRAVAVTTLKCKSAESRVEITMREGRKREVRRMLARVGLKVRRLYRTRIGDLEDPDLRPGSWRKLRAEEVAALRNFSRAESPDAPRRKDAAPHASRPPRTRRSAVRKRTT